MSTPTTPKASRVFFSRDFREALLSEEPLPFSDKHYTHAADVALDDREQVFAYLQNVHDPWTAKPKVAWSAGEEMRSMSIGDVVVEPDGRAWRCVDMGWDEVKLQGEPGEPWPALVESFRADRDFRADAYIKMKCEKLNGFFKDNRLDAAVVGLSGGVDSATVYLLLREAMRQPGSPIRKVLGLILPISGDGTSDQGPALKKALKLVELTRDDHPGMAAKIINLTGAYNSIIENTSGEIDLGLPSTKLDYENNTFNVETTRKKTGAWANGQMASVLRTPVMYYQAAVLQQEGYASVVVGTTNRDEGSYIGFYGKASDGMNDLQPIADIHKSEVYQVAALLGCPSEILEARPQGDVYDGRGDEDMIGAPYFFLELYLRMLDTYTNPHMEADKLEPVARAKFDSWSGNIEALHRKNAHKYQVGLPAHFVDVMKRVLPGGWK
jgi:NAD+ synthase (glutamine-hydrolysing)